MPLSAFSNFAQAKASRQIANAAELGAWLDQIAGEKLGAGARADKARAWMGSVARKRMLREGATLPLDPQSERELAATAPWAERAIERGESLDRLELSENEREELLSILDWMRSDRGPGLASDWSRVSWDQAAKAHQDWIDEMARQASKLVSAQKAFDGCEKVAAAGPDLAGWSWVRVESAQALEREGALMRHCVGSYADLVAEGELSIWSLRDPAGKPYLTLETRESQEDQGLEARQIKGFANAPPTAEHARALSALFEHFQNAGCPIVASGADLAKAGLAVAPKALGGPKLWRQGDLQDQAELVEALEALSAEQAALCARSAAQVAGDLRCKAAFKALAPKLAGQKAAAWESFDVCAAQAGVAWGRGIFSGLAIDPSDPSDARLAGEIASREAASLSPQDAIDAARFAAAHGLSTALEALEPALAKAGEKQARDMLALNRELLESPAPSAFLGGRLWTMDRQEAWRDFAAAIASDGSTVQEDGLTALELCLARKAWSLAEPLMKFLGDASEPWSARAREIAMKARLRGAVLERADASLRREAAIWRDEPELRSKALSRAVEDPTTSNPILLVAAHLGWRDPSQAIVRHLDDHQALALSQELIELGADAAWIGARESLGREALYGLRQKAARAGMVKGVQDTLEALGRLPREAFSDMDEETAQAHIDSFARWRRVFDDLEMCVEQTRANAPMREALLISGDLGGRGDGPRGADALSANPLWRSLREYIGESSPQSAQLFLECLVKALPARCQALAVPGGSGPELGRATRENLAFFFNEVASSDQRQAIIAAVTDFSLMQGPKASMGEKLARRRQAWGDKEPSWAGADPRKGGCGPL